MERPFWLQLHIDNLSSFRSSIRRMIPAFLLAYIVIFFAFTVRLMGLPYLRLRSVSNLDVLEKSEILELGKMIFGFGIAEWSVIVLSVGLVLIWMALGYLAWILICLSVEIIWQLLYPSDPGFFRMYCRIERFLNNALRRPNLISTSIGFLVAASVLVSFRIWQASPETGAIIIGGIFLGLVPYSFIVFWCSFFKIIHRHPNAYNLNMYFFSQHSSRRKLKYSVDLLVFFAFLTWVWLPMYFNVCKGISDKAAFTAGEILNYQGKWTNISQKVIFESNGNARWMLPALSQFEERLDFIGMSLNKIPITRAFPILQKYLFAVVMFWTLFALGIPAVYNSVKERGYRVALKRIIFATIKTTIFLGILQVFVRKTYFISLSEPLGLGATFSFIIAIAISQDEKFYKKWQLHPTNQSSQPRKLGG